MSEWREIASAPKEFIWHNYGQPVLLAEGRRVVIGYWWGGDDLNRANWLDGVLPIYPTHWMPLPDPPKFDA